MNPKQILEQADSCVKCGLCLPHCPTYCKTKDENESPRGRIALVQGLMSGQLPDDERTQGHLQRCLSCGNCEAACPSEVPVTRLLDAAQSHRMQGNSWLSRLLQRRLLDLAAHPGTAMKLLGLYKSTGLQRLLQHSGLPDMIGLATAHRLLATDVKPPQHLGVTIAPRDQQRRVSLFTGCVGRHLDASALDAAVAVLRHLGFGVEMPAAEHCCGALHRHAGLPREADQELRTCSEHFGSAQTDFVLSLSSACAGDLRHAPDFGPRVREICRFLADLEWTPPSSAKPQAFRVAIHTPCTQRNLLGDPSAAFDLLRRIPGLNISALPDNETCCGAAGTYMLREPDLSNELLEDKLESLRQLRPDYLVTSNTGCALHLRAGIAAAGLAIQVCHPVELVERYLRPHG